ncbi:YqaA family protein [Rhizobium sp. SG2393]|uniref:YqaA family protein n=1 Tax=Rhizobium sp. SG2393 TaxID=3276279 RepID=UPI00366E1E46
MTAYIGLFAAAFLAATLFPAQSEGLLAYLVHAGAHSVVLLVAVASLGNVLGSLVNWMIGRGVERFRDRRWFPVSPGRLVRAQAWYHRYGRWSLLASWLPVVGDPITLVAGVLREPLWSFLLLVTLAKTGRYALIAWLLT